MVNPVISDSVSPDFDRQITATLTKLNGLVYTDRQEQWYSCFEDLPITHHTCPPINPETWEPVQLNEKGYIVWEAGYKVCWFAQCFRIPHHLNGYPLEGLSLRFVLTWWADDAKIFVNGQLVQEGDLFESSVRILLTEAAIPGEEFIVALRLVSPGHDIGGLMKSYCVFESCEIAPGFVADEIAVLQRYWQAFEPKKLPLLATELEKINWEEVENVEQFNTSLCTLRQTLQLHAANIKQRCIKMLSHAHLDMAWLWEVEETWDVAQRTFESVLNLQKDFPSLTFCHTSPVLYEWVEKNRPDLFATIQEAVRIQSWDVLGGMWVEPDVNLVSGESIVRQLLYGQRYTQEKFGNIATVAWLTDSFGFCWQLPQLLKQGGIEYFVTQKLHWNDTTQFPHGAFWWESPDGTRIFTLMSPPNIAGIMDTNPNTLTTYAVDWERQTGLQEIFWLPGVGDRGGGPSRDMLEVQQGWQQSPFFPRIEFTTAAKYLQQIQTLLQQKEQQIPIWKDELYLEFHRGCYTTHADQKRYNRRGETLLYQAELWSTLAYLVDESPSRLRGDGDMASKSLSPVSPSIPCSKNLAISSQIETAWKKILFNQFHDILPGTSIPEVFATANREWEEAIATGTEIVEESLRAIARHITLPSPPHPNAKPLLIFNPLNWTRSEVIELPHFGKNWTVYTAEEQPQLTQLTHDTLLFLATEIPSIGYRLFWMCEHSSARQEADGRWQMADVQRGQTLTNRESEKLGSWKEVSEESSVGEQDISPASPASPTPNSPYFLENQTLRVTINPQTGDISSLFDKIRQREILNGAGNQLQAFKDEGQYWDAWNIDPNYEQHPLPPTQLKSIQWLEQGAIRQRLRVVRQLNNSQFTQDYILDTHSPYLKISTTADWQECNVLLKVAFPLNLEADFATYETACGAIERTTKPQTPAEQAKWEVPALQWADLAFENRYGVSILNDCKYGYDATRDRLRLTLLRGSMWPHPDADRGKHHFSYAIYPHGNSWQTAQTVRKGYEFNQPLQVVFNHSQVSEATTTLPPVASLLDLSAHNLVLTAFKPAEDNPGICILRCYECHGEPAELSFNSELQLNLNHSVNLLEQLLPPQEDKLENRFDLIQPWTISSFIISTT